MNKKELIREAAKTTGFTQKQMRTVLDAFIGAIVSNLDPSSGTGVEIQGLGNFYFPRYENFGTINLTTGERIYDGKLFSFNNSLKFSPVGTLREHLKKKGKRVQFRPTRNFNTGELFPFYLTM